MEYENKMSKETIGLAGEYLVASEFCRRGMYCQLTLGNRKKTDLLVVTDNETYRISVKSKVGRSWPKIKGISQNSELLVFVDYADKNIKESPDIYVLDVEAWKKVVKQIKKNKNDPNAILDKDNNLRWPGTGGKSDWVGCEVIVKDVDDYLNKWPKFLK